MKIEKDIVVDKHKGIFDAFRNIFEPFNAEFKLREEFFNVYSKGSELFGVLDQDLKNIRKTIDERNTFMNGYLELSVAENEHMSQKERILKIFKDKVATMQKELSAALAEKNRIIEKLNESEKRYQNLFEEFNLFKQKIKSKISYLHKNEEKFCKNCQKLFFDNENFNWSCRIHSSAFNEGFYWCCGNSVKDSPGCILSKHINKEVDDENKTDELALNKFCAACKHLGHSITACSKDPNFRKDFDMNDEFERIGSLRKQHTRLFTIIQGDEDFDEDEVSTGFEEIEQLKNECLSEKRGFVKSD